MSDLEQQEDSSSGNTIACYIYDFMEVEHVEEFCGYFNESGFIEQTNKFIDNLRKQWEAEQGAKMAPIAGPPDLDGVPDEALFLWTLRGEPLATSWTIATALELRTARISDIIWHIPLGVIELPANSY
jgi:hypothetical protein